jgi:PAS domain-containing protein
MLIGGQFHATGYRFLTARKYMVFNISQLANSTLDGMISTSLLALETYSALFWYVMLSFIVIGLGIAFVFEFANSRRRLWFIGVEFFLRREMNQSPLHTQRVLELINGQNESILEKLPFPAIVKNEFIVDCNQQAADYLGHAIVQVQDQRLEDFFHIKGDFWTTEKGDAVRLHSESFDGLEFVRIEDITADLAAQQAHKEFMDRLSCELKLPFKETVILLSLRLRSDSEALPRIQMTLETVRERFEVKSVIATPGIWRAIAPNCEAAVACAMFFLEAFAEAAIVAIVQGIVTVTGILDGAIANATTGVCVDRADGMLLRGQFGFCYIDRDLADQHSFGSDHLIVNPV